MNRNLALRAVSAAVLSTALATSLAACGAAASISVGTKSSTPSKPAGPLDGLNGSEIAKKAMTNLQQASSVRLAGKVMDSGKPTAIDLTLVRGKGCEGSMSTSSGSFKLKKIGATIWINADRAFWIANGGNDQAVLSMLANKWIKASKSGGLGSSMSELCDLSKVPNLNVSDTSSFRKGGASTVNGQPVLHLVETADSSTIDVSDTADPRVLKLAAPSSTTDGGAIAFTDYNAPVKLVPPPARETVDGKKLGL